MNKSQYHNRFKVFFILTVLTTIVLTSYLYTIEKRKVYLNNMVAYHTKMVKSGSISSLVKLGKMYENGEGVEKNLAKAQELFKKAINFNQYLDEIYPSYSKNASNDDNLNDNADLEEIKYSHFSESFKKTTQLKNVISKTRETEIKFTENKTKSKKNIALKPKYVPYIKKIKTHKVTKKTAIKNRVSLLHKNLNNVKPKHKSTKTKKITTIKIKKSLTVIKLPKLKIHKIYNTTVVKPKKSSTVNKHYKKNIVLKNKTTKRTKQKIKLQAKRSKTLYEERPDYETELVIIEDEELNDSDEDSAIAVQDKTKNEQTVSKFTSNPCATESARYIAKCRRINRRK